MLLRVQLGEISQADLQAKKAEIDAQFPLVTEGVDMDIEYEPEDDTAGYPE